jgi:hypothetical protein
MADIATYHLAIPCKEEKAGRMVEAQLYVTAILFQVVVVVVARAVQVILVEGVEGVEELPSVEVAVAHSST